MQCARSTVYSLQRVAAQRALLHHPELGMAHWKGSEGVGRGQEGVRKGSGRGPEGVRKGSGRGQSGSQFDYSKDRPGCPPLRLGCSQRASRHTAAGAVAASRGPAPFHHGLPQGETRGLRGQEMQVEPQRGRPPVFEVRNRTLRERCRL